MATNIKLKKSSVVGKAPLAGDLDYGEIAINYADGKLFYKNSSNEIKSFIDSAGVEQLIFAAGITGSSQGRALVTEYNYTADSGQTTFSGIDDQGDALDYTGANLLVYLNGISLINGVDYTATTGSSVVLTSATDSGDVVSIAAISGDSSNVTNIVDSAYVQSRQITYDVLDSARILSLISSVSAIDSAAVIGLIDSAYIQARQDFSYSSLTDTPNILDSADVALIAQANDTTRDSSFVTNIVDADYINGLVAIPEAFDSNNVIGLVDSAYVQARVTLDGTDLDSAQIIQTIDNAGYTKYDSNDTIAILVSQNYASETFVTNQINGLIDGAPATLDTLNEIAAALNDDDSVYGTLVNLIGAKTSYDSANAAGQIEEYGYLTSAIDSGNVTGLIDSAYIQARQITYNVLDSAQVAAIAQANDTTRDSAFVTGIIDSAYIAARTSAGTDSSTVINLITGTVDSAYINARVTAVAGGVDSAAIFALIDSAYVAARAPASTGDGGVTYKAFEFTADSGQTVFSGADANGDTLKFSSGQVQVYRNGILLIDSADYTTNGGGTVVTLNDASVADENITIATFTALAGATINAYDYFADSGQTTFSGADIDGNSLAFSGKNILVHVNGLLLTDSDDYTAGINEVTIPGGVDSGDVVSIVAFKEVAVSFVDSAAVSSIISSTVDSAYIQARQSDVYRDSGFVTGIIDSAYVQARQLDVYRDSAFVRSILKDGSVDVINFSDSTAWIDWNSVDGTLNLNYNSGVSLQIGQEQHLYGKASEAISNGDVVMFAGVQGDHPLFAKADVTTPGFIDEWVIGVATQNIALNEFGYVTTYGKVRDLNTSAYNAGDLLWLSSDSAGALTPNRPQAPNHAILIAAVTRSNPGDGHILVRPTFGTHLSDAHDVFIDSTTISNGQFLTWDSANQYWTNGTPNFFDSVNAQVVLDSNFGALRTSIIPVDDDAIDLGSTTKRFRDLYLGPGSLYINNKKVLEDDAGTIRVRTDSDQNLSIRTFGTGQTTMQSETGINITTTTSGDITFTTTDGNVEFNGNIQINSTKSINSSNADPINFGDNIDLNSNRIENVGTPTEDGDAATKLYVDTEINNLIDGAPGTLNTLNEIAAALNDDDSAYVTLVNLIGTKTSYDSTNAAGQIEAYGYITSSLDSAQIIQLITDDNFTKFDSTNVVGILATQNYATESYVTNTIDSAYVRARQDFAYSSLTDAPNVLDSTDVTNHITSSDLDMGGNKVLFGNVYSQLADLPDASTYHGMFAHVHSTGAGYFAHAGNWIQLANYSDISTYGNSDVTSLIDSAYIQARAGTGTDSATVISLITSTVDSAYVALREANTGGGGTGGLDSSAVLNLIPDGSYRGVRAFEFIADSGDTIFTGADRDGNTLAYSPNQTLVFLNGTLLVEGNDYAASNGTSIVFTEGVDSGDFINIYNITAGGIDSAATIGVINSVVNSTYVQERQSTGGLVYNSYDFVADSGQTTFTGTDKSGNTLSYADGKVQVYLNGILLVDSDDFTANDGSSIILGSQADSGDVITISSYGTIGNYGVTLGFYEFTADSGQSNFSGTDNYGQAFTYTAGNILVHLNGILLSDSADYTAIDGSNLVLSTPADSADIVAITTFISSAIDTWSEVAATTYNAVANTKLIVDTDSAAVTVNLPVGPTFGDEIRIVDGTGNAATNNITINRNGSKILGADSDFTLDINRAAIELVYYNTAQGWIISGNT